MGLGRTGGLNNGSPNGPSQVPSPRTMMFGIKNKKPCKLIYQPLVRGIQEGFG
ncbi:Hypothetical predicted protein, partial [Olea europaea subsp. europaea]